MSRHVTNSVLCRSQKTRIPRGQFTLQKLNQVSIHIETLGTFRISRLVTDARFTTYEGRVRQRHADTAEVAISYHNPI